MNPDTGAIAQFETEEDANEAGFTVSLTAEQAGALAGMNREQRRAWLAQNRRSDAVKAMERRLEELRPPTESEKRVALRAPNELLEELDSGQTWNDAFDRVAARYS